MAAVTYPLPSMPYFLQRKPGDGDPIVYSAAEFRRYTAALDRRVGVLGAGDFSVDQALTVGWSILVNSGYAHVGAGTAHYIVALPDDVTVPLTGIPVAPGGTRVHKVWLCVNDALTIGTGYGASIIITEDTGAGAPEPADVAASLLLAHLTVNTSTTTIQRANITNVAPYGGGTGDWFDLSSSIALPFEPQDLHGTQFPPGFRGKYSDGHVRLSGAIGLNGTGKITGGKTHKIGTMWLRLRPKYVRVMQAGCDNNDPPTTTLGTYTCQLRIQPDGVMHIYMPTGQNVNQIFLDGCTYDLD